MGALKRFGAPYNNKVINHLMKTTQLYLVAIALLMYMTYAHHSDDNRQKQQKVEIHRQFCASVDSHPNCEK